MTRHRQLQDLKVNKLILHPHVITVLWFFPVCTAYGSQNVRLGRDQASSIALYKHEARHST